MFANTEVSAAQVLCPERRTTLRLTVLAMSIAIAFNAWGQEAAGGAAPSDTVPASVSPTADSQKMHEVIVTAQKRKQSIQKTPIAMSAVSGDEIAEKAENTIDSVLKTMPSVEVQGHAQGAQVYIRGVGSSIDPSFADPAIALMVDGSYLGRTESAVSGTFDVERVEVLRGPQGTLYGRNASGGVVNVLTVNPILGKFEGNVRVQLGDYALRRGETALNIPLGSVSAMRIAAFSERHRGYVDDGSMDAHDEGIRIKWRIDPIEGWSLVAKAEYYAEHANGSNTVPVPGSAGQLTFPPPLFTTNFDPTITAGPPFTGGAPIWRFPNGWVTKGSDAWSNDPDHPAGHVDRTAKTISAQLDGDLKFASLTVLPSYTVDHNDLLSSFLFGTLTGPYIWGRSVMKYTSVEARLNSLPTVPL
jgi:iron complex outermembrane receptor protein